MTSDDTKSREELLQEVNSLRQKAAEAEDLPSAAAAQRANASGGKVVCGPEAMPGDGREMAVFVLPDRHFFEAMGPRSDT